MTAITEKCADHVYRLRRRRRMTQQEFADYFGVHRRTVIRWEKWGMPWTVLNAEKWNELALDVLVDETFRETLGYAS